MRLSVFGMGYVGLANALLLAQNNDVVAYDIDQKKIEKLIKGRPWAAAGRELSHGGSYGGSPPDRLHPDGRLPGSHCRHALLSGG